MIFVLLFVWLLIGNLSWWWYRAWFIARWNDRGNSVWECACFTLTGVCSLLGWLAFYLPEASRTRTWWPR